MDDPLENFDWARLCTRYDATCHGFDPSVSHLAALTPTPQSDRDLYYRLVDSIHAKPGGTSQMSIGLYEAILYWKLYSNGLARGNVARWLVPRERTTISQGLDRLMGSLPYKIGRDVDCIIAMIKQIGEYSLVGMKSDTSLPVRTTFLHFLFPDVVPIFDKMVLQAVGITDKAANKDIGVLTRYVPFAWCLADRYSAHFSGFRETPVRLIDMALWVSRGGC
jgi:hypothetical protein